MTLIYTNHIATEYMRQTIFSIIKVLAAIAMFFLSTGVYSSEQATYRNGAFGFAFEYPSIYQSRESGGSSMMSIELNENSKIFGNVLELDTCLEENTYLFKFLFFIDKFRSCAIDIARDWCYADGHDGGSYCTSVTDEIRYNNKYGVPIIILHFMNVSEYYEAGKQIKGEKIIGPVFIADISKDPSHQRALMFNLANDRPLSKMQYIVTKGIVDTIKLEN